MTDNAAMNRLVARQSAYRTDDPYMKELVQHTVMLSFRNEPVLILGETGTGKELIANMLHGTRVDDVTVVNTTAVTDTLFESELFGHAKGAFTGAVADRAGLVEAAGVGTLFLDEIGDMPLTLQAKILRLVQFRTYRRVGENTERTANCRIIAATCQNITDMIDKKLFRDDLYYRLSTFTLQLTPLRERRDDIMQFFMYHPHWHLVENEHKEHFRLYAAHADVKGNYRELERVMLRYEVLKELPTVNCSVDVEST